MLDAQSRLDVLSAAYESLDRDARPTIEAIFTQFFRDHDEITRVRWTQSLDHPSDKVLVMHDVVFDLAGGGSFIADTATFVGARQGELDPLAYALLTDILLGSSDVLVAAFGLNVTVTATPTSITTAPRAS